jgi:hypothetical protein
MKKIGLLAMVLVFALGGLGVGYAHWSETLEIQGDISTGDINPYFTCLSSNDTNDWDPDEGGYWDGSTWMGDRRAKNIGSICASGGGDDQSALDIEVLNAYPCYYGSVLYCIRNSGTVPVNIVGITLTHLSGPNDPRYPLPSPICLTPDTPYYIDVETGTVSTTPPTGPPTPTAYDFSIIVSDLTIGAQIDPFNWDTEYSQNDIVDELFGDLTIHVENGAEEEGDYDFTIAIEFWNYPEGEIDD